MNLLKANRSAQAIKEVEKLDPSKVEGLNIEIKESEKNYFHVISVKINNKLDEAKNEVVLAITKHHGRSFEKFNKNHRYLGYNRLIVLHDPSQMEGTETKQVPEHIVMSETEKVRKEMESKHQAEIDAKVKEGIEKAMAKKTEDKNVDPASQLNDEDELDEAYSEVIESGKKDDFLAFANDYGIDLSEAKNNDERKALIVSWYETKED